MKKLTEKCEGCLLETVKKQQGAHVLETLAVAQSYALESVVAECINKTQSLSLKELMDHEMYVQIEPLSQRKMVESQMRKVEKEVERLKGLGAKALANWESVVFSIADHIRYANNVINNRSRLRTAREYPETVNGNMETIRRDDDIRDDICYPFSETYNRLQNLYSNLQAIAASNH